MCKAVKSRTTSPMSGMEQASTQFLCQDTHLGVSLSPLFFMPYSNLQAKLWVPSLRYLLNLPSPFCLHHHHCNPDGSNSSHPRCHIASLQSILCIQQDLRSENMNCIMSSSLEAFHVFSLCFEFMQTPCSDLYDPVRVSSYQPF